MPLTKGEQMNKINVILDKEEISLLVRGGRITKYYGDDQEPDYKKNTNTAIQIEIKINHNLEKEK